MDFVCYCRHTMLHPFYIWHNWQDMSLVTGAEGGSALVLISTFNGSNIALAKWQETLGSAAHLYQVLAWLVTELTINLKRMMHTMQ